MPKSSSTKRAAARQAARVRQAHQTPYDPTKQQQRLAARKAKQRKRGLLSRYPWAVALITLAIVGGVFGGMAAAHAGPFATHPVAKTRHPATKATPSATATALTVLPPATNSPCLKIVKQLTDTAPIPNQATITRHYRSAPPMTINTNKLYCAGINTQKGLIVVELEPKLAPIAVNNFVFLAEHNFYDGLDFWRVEHAGQPSVLGGTSTLNLIQGGAPLPGGKGDVGYTIPDEPVHYEYTTGIVAMAKTSAPNSASSQFFIDTGSDTDLDSNPVYQIFGQVVQGLNVAQQIKPGDKMTHVIIQVAP
jgi:peptidylprolyl isomerase